MEKINIMSKSNKRELIYNYIVEHTSDKGYAPTIREICTHLSITSTSAVHYHVECLRRDGKLQSVAGKSRSLTSTMHSNWVNAPLVGSVSAGLGSLAIQNIDSYYPIPSELYGTDNVFLLRVDGDSMIESGINDDDIVVVHSQASANIGDIVVVYWDGVATVKRLASLSPLTLHPENITMQDIFITNSQDCMIVGKVIGCLKKF